MDSRLNFPVAISAIFEERSSFFLIVHYLPFYLPEEVVSSLSSRIPCLFEAILETTLLLSDSSFQELWHKLAALDKWLKEHGGTALKGKVEYAIFGDAGVGVYANDDVEPEETVCAVPVRLCISYPVAYEWAKPFLWFEPESKVHRAVLLYLLLMNERFFNPNSFWKPFLDALPDDYPLPLFWGEKALALLNGTPMRAATVRVLRVLRRNYDAIVGGLARQFPLSVFTFERFLWAHATLWTRCFSLPVHANDSLYLSVVPLIDMFNHHPSTKHVILLDENDMVRFRSLQAYTRGAQLWNCYGKKNNSTLLFHYGFSLKDNPHKDSVVFHVILTYRPFVAGMADKEALLEKKGGRLFVGQGDDALTSLLAAARILTSTQMELYFYDELAPNSTPISPANELLAFRDVNAMIDTAMARLPLPEELERLRSVATPFQVDSAENYRAEMIALVKDFRTRLQAIAPRRPPPVIDNCRASWAATQATDWLQAHGKLHPCITCIESRGGESGPRGFRLLATGVVETGEVILRLPMSETLTVTYDRITFHARQFNAARNALASPLGQELKKGGFSADDIFICWICQQREERKSAWRSLWPLLESTLPSVPIWQDEKDIAVLVGTPLHAELLEVRKILVARHTPLTAYSSSHGLYAPTLAAFEWAYALTLALSHPMIVRGTPSLCMLPLLGAFDYSPNSRAMLLYEASQDSWVLRAAHDLKPGEGIADSYGGADNFHLLLWHGFASIENRNDVIGIELQVQSPEEDELHAVRLAAMQAKDLTLMNYLRKESLSQRLLGVMRIAVATQSELEAPPKNVRFASLMITPRNELAALTMLSDFLQTLELPEMSADAKAMPAVYRASYDEILRSSHRLVRQQQNNLRD